ncbi:hypothetical protein Mlute_00943 [Meiothermus luteus]|jgi:hypothetical protein|uniref:Uncharacterized protein n=1 Tax=Meiothermus luteus TaxID=2026184 RepID=A0A399EYX7_9DEIN|nr:hypothetical protein [Meiothermus luteus]RIH87511.1 hypothetical protein Mlute_00943 [Meiothermus luteus]RMH58730.1 MAG: hypothetical protein D6684_00495 [Deinococcota bacterium]
MSRELFPLAVLAGGLYLGLGRLKNLRDGQGCPKCESLQALVAFGLAAWAGWELWQAYGQK